jgi:hypothetical protein
MDWVGDFKYRRRVPDKEQSPVWDASFVIALPEDMKEPFFITHIDGITRCDSAEIFADGEKLCLKIVEPVYVYFNKAEREEL